MNRTGFEPSPGQEDNAAPERIEFWGQSFVAAPDRSVICRASAEAILVVPLDLTQPERSRTHWPFLRDRRIDAYGDMTKRYIDAN